MYSYFDESQIEDKINWKKLQENYQLNIRYIDCWIEKSLIYCIQRCLSLPRLKK